MSLVWKMTLIMTLILLAPMGVLCVSYIQTFRVSAREELDNKLQTSLNHMQSNMDDSLNEAESIFNELFYQVDFPYYLDSGNVLSKKEIRHYISNLQNEKNNIKYAYSNKFSNIGIYSSNRQIDEEEQEWMFYLDDLKLKPYYKEIEEQEGPVVYGTCRPGEMISSTFDTSALNLADEGRWVVPLYCKVNDLNSRNLVGVVELDIEAGKFAGMDALKKEDSETTGIVITPEGEVAAATKKLPEEFVQKILRVAKKDKGSADFTFEGEHFRLKYEKNTKSGTVGMVLHSQERILSYIKGRSFQIVLTTFVCLLILVAVTHYIMKGMLKRLVVLDKMMGKVGHGDFSAEIPELKNTEDEITRITRTFNKMTSRLNQVMEEKVEGEKTKKDAELRALQAQINPHFLYNTLENMRMQCEIEEYDNLQESLSALGDLFRYSISWGSNEAPFSKEWQNLLDYLNIMKMRFDEQLECTLECEEGLDEILVPKLILQPIVENSFNHGFKDKMPPWKLWVDAHMDTESQALVITVRDNGAGIEPERMKRLRESLKNNQPFENQSKKRKSIGVGNVKQRIEMLCAPGSSFEIANGEQAGVEVKIIIKVKEEEHV